MSSLKAFRWISALCVSAVLSACGASQFGPGASGTASQLGIAAERLPHGGTWMDAGAGQWTLLYVSEGNGVVNVYRYWQRNLIGVLTDFKQPMGQCVDNSGDIYITDYAAGRVVEYSHGAEKPIRSLTEGGDPYACTVDLRTGNLAVANFYKGVYVYPHGVGRAIVYTDRALDDYEALAYDDKGNLLVTDGCPYTSSCYGSGFAYLPRGRGRLISIDIPGQSSGSRYDAVTGIQWDGRYFVLDDYYLYRVTIRGDEGRVVSETRITPTGTNPVWIYNNDPQFEGTQVVGTTASDVDFWKYPAGGSPIARITHGLDNPFAASVSLKIKIQNRPR